MQNEFMRIVRELDLVHPDAIVLREAIERCSDPQNEMLILEKTEPPRKSHSDSQEYRALRSLCRALQYYQNSEAGSAVKEAINALDTFRCCGNPFNEGLSRRFLSAMYRAQGDVILEIAELDRARQIFGRCCEIEECYDKKTSCERQIHECERWIKQAKATLGSVSRASNPDQPKRAQPSRPAGRLVHLVYDIAHASRDGRFVLDDGPVGEMSIAEIEFDDKPHRIYVLREGTEFTLTTSGDYRWLRVAGESMNQAIPIAIDPDDYILVDLKQEPQTGTIVFASLEEPPTPQERAGVIKRFTREGLKSESRETIEPIPLDEVSIRGVVVAVAKSI